MVLLLIVNLVNLAQRQSLPSKLFGLSNVETTSLSLTPILLPLYYSYGKCRLPTCNSVFIKTFRSILGERENLASIGWKSLTLYNCLLVIFTRYPSEKSGLKSFIKRLRNTLRSRTGWTFSCREYLQQHVKREKKKLGRSQTKFKHI